MKLLLSGLDTVECAYFLRPALGCRLDFQALALQRETLTYAAVAAKRHQRSPAVTPARLVNSPTLLTGLLKCGVCGAGMTLATGKGGRYRYYKCNTRIAQHAKACTTPAVPMDKLDALVLTALADKVLTPERLKAMLQEMRLHLKQAQAQQSDGLRVLQKELDELETATNRLYEAVEKGLLPMDDMLSRRVQKLKARRDAVMLEMAGAWRTKDIPLAALSSRQLDSVATAMRSRLLDRSSGFSKRYLRQFVSAISFDGQRVRMQGKKAALLAAAMGEKMGTSAVPTSGMGWLPDLGSNQGPAD